MMPPSRDHRLRFYHRNLRPFLRRHEAAAFLAFSRKRKPFRAKEVPRAEPAGQGTDLDSSHMSLATQSSSSLILTPPNFSMSSSESLTTVKRAPVRGKKTDPDESQYFVPVSKQPAGIFAQDTVTATVPNEAQTNGAGEFSVTNGVSHAEAGEDEDSDAMSDMDEAMPEPVSIEKSDYELKLITLDNKTSLVVIDPRSFSDKSYHITLFNGCVALKLIHGNIRLNGYEMRAGEEVKGCTGGSKDFILIEGIDCKSTTEKLTAGIKSALDPKSSPKVIREISSFNNYPQLSVLLISKWDDYRLSFIRGSLSNCLPDPNKVSQKPFFDMAFSKNDSCIGEEWMPLIHHRFLSCINNETILLVTGQPEAGKSILLKRIINTIMSEKSHFGISEKIIYVDLDPGQTEFSPPAQVTAVEIHFQDGPLISRSYANSLQLAHRVICGVSVGSIDIASVANVYIRGVSHLMTEVREAVKKSPCPVFVNTSGFNQRIGRSLLIDAIRMIQPTVLIEIKESLDNSNDCKFDVIFGPRAVGFMTDFKSFQNAHPYTYIDLKSTGKRNKVKAINVKNRESQILAALAKNPELLVTPLSQLDRVTVDLKNVIHFTSPASFNVAAVVDKLHHAFVQLVELARDSSPGGESRGVCVTKDLKTNTIIGYGILFVSRNPEGEVRLEVATHDEIIQNVNCIIVPDGVVLPAALLI